MTNVFCVLRSGGHYSRDWVDRLKQGVEEHLPGAGFFCLTDSIQIQREEWGWPLRYDWPGWWSKLELFRPDLVETGPVLYLDLDTLVTGDLSEIASFDGEFAGLRSFFGPKAFQSAVMAFRPGEITRRIWDVWLNGGPVRWQERYKGDGEWLNTFFDQEGIHVPFLQDLFPGQIFSYKKHCWIINKDFKPEGARLVCGHGVPKFSSPDAGWAHEAWKDQ